VGAEVEDFPAASLWKFLLERGCAGLHPELARAFKDSGLIEMGKQRALQASDCHAEVVKKLIPIDSQSERSSAESCEPLIVATVLLQKLVHLPENP
jgi:hypothetical protein